MEIVVKVAEGVAGDDLDDDAPALRTLRSVAARFDTSIEPVFRGADDPELASYFRAGVADDATDAIVAELRLLHFVESAYAKPLATPPTPQDA